MAKPASSCCNLDCRYCFYLDKPPQPVMDDATLTAFIQQHIAAQPGQDVFFVWQDGEPTLCGLDFYHRVVALQKQYGTGKQIRNTFRTRGMSLDDGWCQFLHDEDWLVDLLLDGNVDLHDACRVSRSTHQKVLEKLVEHDVTFNLLVIVNRLNSEQPEQMYRHLRQPGTAFLQFIPRVERDENGQLTANSVEPQAWGTFLNTVFDLWVREDIGRVFIPLFDSTLGVWCGCLAQTLSEMKKTILSADCQACSLLRFCHGGCPKHRDENGKSVLCTGYSAFISYSAPYMRVMRDLIRQHRSPSELMAMLR